MGIHTSISFMLLLTIGTPHSLKMENVEVHVSLEVLDQLDRNFLVRMRKATKIPVLALVGTINIRGTKLGFVFIRMVELFYSIVSFDARVALLAMAVARHVGAEIRCISSERSTPVFLDIMEVGTSFWVMRLLVTFAMRSLESHKIQKLDETFGYRTFRSRHGRTFSA